MFNSPNSRVVYRFVEIFLVAGAVALVQDPQFSVLVGPAVVAVVAAVLKAVRESRNI